MKLSGYIEKSADPWGLLEAGVNRRRAEIIGECVGRAGRVLDIGCGFGIYSDMLRKLGNSVVGVDASRRMVSDGGKIFPRVAFALGKGEKLPFASDSFNGALCMGTLIYSKNREAFLSELNRVLKKNGRLCVIERNRNSPLHAAVGKIKRNEKSVDKPGTFFSRAELERLLTNAGFRVTGVEGDYIAPFRCSSAMAKIFPTLAYFIAISCEKY